MIQNIFGYDQDMIMIDIETLSTKVNAVVVSVAGIRFNLKNKFSENIDDYDTFYMRVDPKTCRQYNCVIDNDTMKWWKKQPIESQKEIFTPKNRHHIKTVLLELSKWFGKNPNTRVFANSPNFDISILDYLYDKCKLKSPWKYWNVRCTRTVYELGGVNMRNVTLQGGDSSHHALYDCLKQIKGLYLSFGM